MSALDNRKLALSGYKLRMDGDEFIVRFENHDEYYVINETGKTVLDYLRNGRETFASLVTYLRTEFSDFSEDSALEIRSFIDALVGLEIITVE